MAEDNSNILQNKPVSIQDEMRTRYLDYAMSVIIGRAIPDVRDGLKPVHRRILYSMHEQKPRPERRRTRSARSVVGDVLGKYHPHGDASVYDALVRMAQDFRCATRSSTARATSARSTAIRRPPYATPRRVSRASPSSCLSIIDKDTVDLQPNFDDSEARADRPAGAAFRNLLVNGSGGIAVGMATNIPPHNLGEIIDATIDAHPQLRSSPSTTSSSSSPALTSRPAASSTVAPASSKRYRTGRGAS